MPYTMFHDRFPQLAEEETRTLTVFGDAELPPDRYVLMELYCDEPGCDCRRVMFNVFSDRRKRFVAVIAYGWESEGYYRNWARAAADEEILREMKGPVLNRLSPQSPLAPALLEMVEGVVLRDPDYIERLKRHYRLFRETVDGKRSGPVGRNDPCPCGSGKKYKHCCLHRRADG